MKRRIIAGLGALALAAGMLTGPAASAAPSTGVLDPSGAVRTVATKTVPISRAVKANVQPVKASKPTARLVANYFYAAGYQYTAPGSSEGAYANISIANPFLASTTGEHSLGQIAVQSADGFQKVEIGWTKDSGVCVTSPCLFTYSWVNNVGQGYNVGFVPASGATIAPGATLTVSTSMDPYKRFGAQFFSGNWWLNYNNEWIGYFPASVWSGVSPTFNKMGLGQVFGEVASTNSAPCTDMGNGNHGVVGGVTSTTAAIFNSWTKINPSTSPAAPANSLTLSATDATKYSIGFQSGSVRSGRFGGPGYC